MTVRMNPLALALLLALSQGGAIAEIQPRSPSAPPSASAARTSGAPRSATQQVERAASWAGAEVEAGAAWTNDELASAYALLRDAFDSAGNRAVKVRKDSPFDVGT